MVILHTGAHIVLCVVAEKQSENERRRKRLLKEKGKSIPPVRTCSMPLVGDGCIVYVCVCGLAEFLDRQRKSLESAAALQLREGTKKEAQWGHSNTLHL